MEKTCKTLVRMFLNQSKYKKKQKLFFMLIILDIAPKFIRKINAFVY